MSRRVESKSSRRPVKGAVPRPAVAAAREGALQAPPPVWTSALVGALFAALYLVLAPPVTGPKDAAEFTVVLATNGAAHPTGYPLYVMLGHFFVTLLHALGASWAYAANAWSAIGGGVAIALLHALALRLIPPRSGYPRQEPRFAPPLARFALATCAAGVFALSPIWLLDAILAEVYTWHLAWVAGVSLFVLAAIRGLAARDVAPARVTRGAVAWGFLAGVGLAHHLTAVVVLVPLTAALGVALLRARRWRGSLAAVAFLAALPPLAAYLFIAWRAFHPAAWQWELLEPTWASVFAHIRGAAYGDLLGHFAPDAVQAGLLRTYCWPVLFPALALLGVAVFRARGPERLARGAFLAAAILQTLYAFEYGVRDPSCYFEPAMALALLGVAALGAEFLGSRGAARAAPAAVGGLLVVLGVVWLPLGASIRSGTIETDRRVRALWRAVPPGPGFVLWDHDMVATFALYQVLEGRRPDLFAGSPATLSWRGPRHVFEKKYGFDPLAGLEPLNAERAARIPENLARQTPLAVRVFDLENQRLVEVPKP